MKQLSLNIAKDTKITDLACSPNVIVLAKESTTTNAKTGEVTTRIRYIEVCKAEKTDPLAIVQSLLRYITAEFFVSKDLENDFAGTNIKQRKIFGQFLSGNTIYRTDSNGRITNALVSEVPLRQTALNVKDYHAITTCKRENLKAAIYQHAKAIRAQCAYITLITKEAERIENDGEKAAPAPAKITRRTTTATASTPAPAMVAAPAQ